MEKYILVLKETKNFSIGRNRHNFTMRRETDSLLVQAGEVSLTDENCFGPSSGLPLRGGACHSVCNYVSEEAIKQAVTRIQIGMA